MSCFSAIHITIAQLRDICLLFLSTSKTPIPTIRYGQVRHIPSLPHENTFYPTSCGHCNWLQSNKWLTKFAILVRATSGTAEVDRICFGAPKTLVTASRTMITSKEVDDATWTRRNEQKRPCKNHVLPWWNTGSMRSARFLWFRVFQGCCMAEVSIYWQSSAYYPPFLRRTVFEQAAYFKVSSAHVKR